MLISKTNPPGIMATRNITITTISGINRPWTDEEIAELEIDPFAENIIEAIETLVEARAYRVLRDGATGTEGMNVTIDVYAVTPIVDGRPFNVDNMDVDHIRQLRESAYLVGDEKLAETCTLAIGTVGKRVGLVKRDTDEEFAARRACVAAMNKRMAGLTARPA
jgi:hypothetical protein